MLRFVINLDKATNRWTHMQRALSRFDIEFERISAIDGRRISKDDLAALVPPLNDLSKIICPRAVSPAEIGAFLSHKNCWKKLVDSGENWALIMEDDINFSSRARSYITSIDWIPQGLDIIQLFVFRQNWKAKVGKNKIRLSSGDMLLRPYKPSPVGAQAYFISRQAAESALEMSCKIMAPVDEFLFNPMSDFATRYPVYRLNPAVVMPLDDELPSTIGLNKTDYPFSKWIRNHPLRKIKQLQLRCRILCFSESAEFTFR